MPRSFLINRGEEEGEEEEVEVKEETDRLPPLQSSEKEKSGAGEMCKEKQENLNAATDGKK